MLKMAKVLFDLNFVDHLPTHRRGTCRKLVSSQRKKPIMACFRMAPLHSVPRYRAMNMFLCACRKLWLKAEEDTRARLIEHLREEFEEVNGQEVTTIKEETETETEILTLTMTIKPNPLRKRLQCLNQPETTAKVFSITENVVYLSYSTIMNKSCVIEEDDDDGGAEEVKPFQSSSSPSPSAQEQLQPITIDDCLAVFETAVATSAITPAQAQRLLTIIDSLHEIAAATTRASPRPPSPSPPLSS